ncbi:MAG TPA: ATP-binding cassette domain-containing protein [Chloroflexota bacterium]
MSIRLLDDESRARSTQEADEQADEPAITVSGLRKTYSGGVAAVKGVSFDVAQGEVFGLVGPNGAGKSTTIGMLTSTVVPDEGTARLAGIDVATDPIGARRVSSVVFQESVVDRALSGTANLLLHARLWGVPKGNARSRIKELAASFGLDGIIDRPVATYSGGQRRRLEIARALVSEPRVLFLDEPTVGLDPRIRYELLDVIAGLRDSAGVTILLTTHYLDEAERLCDRVAVMYEGRIVALDTPSNLLAGLGTEVVEVRVDGDVHRVRDQLRRAGLASDDAYVIGSTVTLPLRNAAASETLAGIGRLKLPLAALSARRPTLDDVYLRLTGGQYTDAA